jgi:hypothetical protein
MSEKKKFKDEAAQRWFDTFDMNFTQPYNPKKQGYKITREMVENTLKYIDTKLALETDPNTGEMSTHEWIEGIKTVRHFAIGELASLNQRQSDSFHIIL